MPTSNYQADVKVEIAFDSGFTTPDASRTWTDVSAYVELADSVGATGGRGNERGTADANTLSLVLDNSDGRFTFGRSSSPYYPNVRIGRPIRVTADPVDGAVSTRFVGFVNEWPTAWDGTDAYAYATVTATSRMAWLGATTPLKSIVEETVQLDSPTAYYTLGEAAGATQANDSSGNNMPPLTFAGSADPSFLGTGTAGPVIFGSATGPGTDSLTAAQFSGAGGQWLSGGASPFVPAGALTASCFFSSATAPTPVSSDTIFLALTDTSNRGVGLRILDSGVGTAGAVRLVVFLPSGLVYTGGPVSSANLCDGATHHVALVHDGSTTTTLYVDGVSQGSVTNAQNAQTWSSLTVLQVGGHMLNLAGLGLAGVDVSPFIGVMAHVATFAAALTSGQVSALSASGLTGFAGETTDVRLKRYASFAGIAATEFTADVGVETMAHIDTRGRTVLEMMRDCETTEGGILFDNRDGTIGFHNRSRRYVLASLFTLDMGAQMVETGYAPKTDRAGLLNDVTATNADGTVTARKTDPTSTADYGLGVGSPATGSADDDGPGQMAGWFVYAYKDPRERAPSLTVNALAQVGKTPNCAAVMAATVSSKITLSNRPSQAAAATATYFVEGWTETYGPESLMLTWNVSPTSPWDQVFVLGDASRGVLGTNPLAW